MSHSSTSNRTMSFAYGKVWMFFIYYWIIFGIGCYFGQFLPQAWRQPLSIGLFVLLMFSLLINKNRKYGIIISHIYAIVTGLLSYAAFSVYLANLGPEVFFKNILLAIGAFIAFGIIGYFMIDDASGMGKYLFATLIALIVAQIIGWFLHNDLFHTIINSVGLLLFLLYTIYDFNRMKRGHFSPREMGFNLFINLLNIIRRLLYLANKFNRR